MIRRLARYFIIILLTEVYFSCASLNGQLSLIIYTDFMNPKSTYDSLRKDIMFTGLVDSIIIIGIPIVIPVFSIQIDSLKTNQFGISYDDIYDKIKESAIVSNSFNELQNIYMKTKSDQKIPISAFVSFYTSQDYYKPEIFKPKPESFYYQGIKAVKIEFYYEKRNEKALNEYIKSNIDDYSDVINFNYDKIEYEIVKNKKYKHTTKHQIQSGGKL